MTVPRTGLDSPGHLEQAQSHLRSAEAILNAGEGGWAVTAAFYSAFHVMRAAILEDPIWDRGPVALTNINPMLGADCQFAEHHQGNPKTNRSPGVREVVGYLYPQCRDRYLLLHGASITVRYKEGESRLLSPCGNYVDVAKSLLDEYQAGTISTS